MSDDRPGRDRNLRIDIHLYWPSGWWDRLLRLARRLETVKSWITLALLAAIVGLLLLQAFRGPTQAPHPPTPDPGPPPVVRPEPRPNGEIEDPRPRPVPVPQPPPQPQPEEEPAPAPAPEVSDSPLTKAVREYIRTLPQVFTDLADAVEKERLKDKDAAVAFHKQAVKQHQAALGAALDQVFSAGSDKKGKITDPGKIAGPLRETATALGAGRVRTTALAPGGFR
jgi:outer membrane biosynthesis protein TonB